MKPTAKLAIVGVFVIAAIAIVFVAKGKSHDATSTTKPEPGVAQTEITFVYSTEKKDWIDAATADFAKVHPDVKVTLVGKGSLDAAQEILDGTLQPTLWSPADSMAMNLLASDWQTKNHTPIVAASGDDAPQPLVLTPLVFVCWEDRAQVLLKASNGAVSWKAISKAVTSPQGWPAIGGPGKWGFVKLGHTDPTKSNSGLEALYLMSLEYFGKPKLAIEDLLDAKYQDFVKGIEKGVTKFEASTGTFMTDMVRFGPSKYDVAVVYESLAISELANAAGRWGKLKVYYPATTIWSDHPIAVLAGAWVTPAQQKAARQLVAFLRSKPAQQRALDFGFRPADTSVPIVTQDPQNPFTRLAADGITVDVPPAAETPDGTVVRNLMMMWSRVVAP
ncbi:MAG TPA: substrate-binding domain-containing protein [Kofleriaceae bacterium]|jgi:ABC-type Fe3+ transport system substrate-binding protein|nr:substrate-binding domain-containing protein [Kofleriaceae bacterium]